MGMKFFSLPKAKHFNITTRFYDPRKEAMREREERIRRELEKGSESNVSHVYSNSIKGSFRTAAKINSRSATEARRKSNMRLLYIIIILSVLFYFFLK